MTVSTVFHTQDIVGSCHPFKLLVELESLEVSAQEITIRPQSIEKFPHLETI